MWTFCLLSQIKEIFSTETLLVSTPMESFYLKATQDFTALKDIWYIITIIAKSKDEVSWCCGKRDCVMKCAAGLKTKSTLDQYVTGARLVREHSHPADEARVSVEKCYHSMNSSASTANDEPITVHYKLRGMNHNQLHVLKLI